MHPHVHIKFDTIRDRRGQISNNPIAKALAITIHPVGADIVYIDGAVAIVIKDDIQPGSAEQIPQRVAQDANRATLRRQFCA